MDTVAVGPKYNSDTASIPLTSTNQTGSITNVLAPVEGADQESSLHQVAVEGVDILQKAATRFLGGASSSEAYPSEKATGTILVSSTTKTQGNLAHSVPMNLPMVRAERTASNSTATEQYFKEATGSRIGANDLTCDISNAGGVTSAAGFNQQYRQEQTRKVSSTVIESMDLESPPEDKITYIDVPTYEEEVVYVTKKEVREVLKTVHKPVHVPKEVVVPVAPEPIVKKVIVNEYVDKIVEKRVEKIKEVPTPNYVDVIEYNDIVVVKEVPKIEYYDVESVHYVDQPVEKIEYEDEEVPVIISQQIKPVFVESPNCFLDVNVVDYEPEVIPIDIHVAKPVQSMLRSGEAIESTHKLVTINSAQYNTILRRLNTHLEQKYQSQLPFISESNVINFVPEADSQYIIAPSGIEIVGYQLKQPTNTTSAITNSAPSLTTTTKSNNPPQTSPIKLSKIGGSMYYSKTTSQQQAGGNGGDEVFEGYREIRESAAPTSVTSSAANQVMRSARVCCNVNAGDMSSQGTSVTSSKPDPMGQSHLLNTTQQASAGGVKDYAVKLAEQRASHNTTLGTQSDRLTVHQMRGQGATYPSSNRHVPGSRQSLSGSSMRVDTVQSYRSQLDQANARRSRVCC